MPGRDEGPWTSSGFWILQLVVLALTLVRVAATVAFHLDTTSLVLEFSTLALFLIPVVYAALNYGLAGALFTSGWLTVLAIPRFFAAMSAHEYVAAWAELMQVVLLDVLAFLIGQRVSCRAGGAPSGRDLPRSPSQCRSHVPRPVRLEPGADPHRRP